MTYVLRAEKVLGVCNDLTDDVCYGDKKFINNLAKTLGNMDCIDKATCTDAAAYVDTPVNAAYADFTGVYYPRGCGPEPLKGNNDYAQFANFVGLDYSVTLTTPEVVNSQHLELQVALWRYMTVRGTQPTLHEIAI
jgi:hypothetical protein